MTELFGGFNKDFYDGYNSEWPLPEVGWLVVRVHEWLLAKLLTVVGL